jgi:predicted transcriptional regulator of viral defense system
MAKSTQITKSLTVEQMEFLKYLDNEEIHLFTLDTVRDFAGKGTKTLNEIIENLVRKDFVYRIERGKYCRSTFKDEHVTGTFIVPDGTIAYWSALHLYGLTEQFPNTIFVQTTLKKNPVTVMGTHYRFIKVAVQKRTGIIYNGYGNYKYLVTDLEKTIADCFDLPQYSGGYAELIRAFAQATLDAGKLTDYCQKINNIAAIKRIGFLSELLEKKSLETFTAFARTKVNRTCNLFDPFGNKKGEIISDWNLRLNISKETIRAIIQNSY